MALQSNPRHLPPNNIKLADAREWGRNDLEKSLMMYMGAASFEVRDTLVLGCCLDASTVAGRSTLVMLLAKPDSTAMVPPPQAHVGRPVCADTNHRFGTCVCRLPGCVFHPKQRSMVHPRVGGSMVHIVRFARDILVFYPHGPVYHRPLFSPNSCPHKGRFPGIASGP